MGNPFRPTFGVTPPVLAGRDTELTTFTAALDDGPGAPGRAMLLTGPRGSGKTVLLNALEDAAVEHGWLVVSESTRPGVAEALTIEGLPRLLQEHHPDPDRRTGTGGGVTLGPVGGSVSREYDPRFPVRETLRSQLRELARIEHVTGVVLTLDEIHTAAIDDLREITQAVQHGFREQLDVAFVAAGLPSAVADLLNDEVSTFLRRAERFTLGRLGAPDVRRAFVEPLAEEGRTAPEPVVDTMVEATDGYPFMVQLVGYHTVAAAGSSARITAAHAERGIAEAAARVGRLVLEPALAGLSEVDRRFLRAMLPDAEVSVMQDVTRRMKVSKSYAGQYRRRLLDAEVIESVGHGKVRYSLPYLRDHLSGEG